MTTSAPIAVPRRRIGFDRINRRTHLYSGLFFIPWFLFYGLSSAVFNHPKWFSDPPKMSPLFDREYTAETAPEQGDPRPFVTRALHANGLDGPYAVTREHDGGIITINQARFLYNTRISWNPATRRLTAERAWVNWRVFLSKVHTRGGLENPDPAFLLDLWSVIVDLIQLAMIIWIASGLYMWWHLKRFRGWGWLALGSGFALFAAFVSGL